MFLIYFYSKICFTTMIQTYMKTCWSQTRRKNATKLKLQTRASEPSTWCLQHGNVWYPHSRLTRCSRKRQTSPPVPPPGELDEKYASSLILTNSLHYMKTWRRPQNRKYINYCITVRGRPSHVHLFNWFNLCLIMHVFLLPHLWWNKVVCITYTENLVWNLETSFLRYASKQTDMQTRKTLGRSSGCGR